MPIVILNVKYRGILTSAQICLKVKDSLAFNRFFHRGLQSLYKVLMYYTSKLSLGKKVC